MLKSGKQLVKQREILVASLVNQIMQCFSSIAHMRQVAAELLLSIFRFLFPAHGGAGARSGRLYDVTHEYAQTWVADHALLAGACDGQE